MEATQVECRNKEEANVTNDNTTSWRNSFTISSKMIRLFLHLFNIPMASYLVEGVIISLTIVEYGVLVLLMQYLTSVFKFSLVRAAVTVNMFYFISGILAIVAELCKLRVGYYFMVQVNCISYILALVVLLKNFPAPESVPDQKSIQSLDGPLFLLDNFPTPKSVPDQKSIHALHGALFLLALGRSVFISTCTKDFVGAQMRKARRVSDEDNDKRDDVRSEISIIRAKIVGFGFSNWLLTEKWRDQFLISICILSVATFCLLVWKVLSIMSSTTFSLLQSPVGEDDRSEHYLALRRNQHSGITRTSLRSAAPICLTFLMYGIVHSTGETFFQNQAENSNTSSMGNEKASLMTLQIIAKTTKFFINRLVSRVLSGRSRTGTPATLIQMGLGMLFSVVTCSVAQYTEVVRLAATKHNNCSAHKFCQIDVALFIPQFITLGFFTGLAGKGLEAFLEDEYSNWIKIYATTIYEVLTGIGYLVNAFLVLMLRSATTWFAKTLDTSRVDVFYHVIAVMCVLNFIPLYALVSTFFFLNKLPLRSTLRS